jgi:hypothetical protein
VYSPVSQRLLVFCICAAPIVFLHPSSPGYLTRQDSIAVAGVDDLVIRA